MTRTPDRAVGGTGPARGGAARTSARGAPVGRRSKTFLAVATLVALLGTACGGGEREALSLEVAVSPTPAAVGHAQVRVTVRDSADAPVADARVVVAAAPPAGANGASGAVTDTARAVRPGLWVVDSLPFASPGEWTLEATATLPDGRRAARRHPIRVLGGAGPDAGSGGGPEGGR